MGYTLDELPNDITKMTPASFEPVLDYVVVKVPRFAFEKFPTADPYLTTQMKSVGESMAIGRTFKEALQKGFRGLEAGRAGWVIGDGPIDDRLSAIDRETLIAAIRRPTPERLFQVKRALVAGVSVSDLHDASGIDPWFLDQLAEIVAMEDEWIAHPFGVNDDVDTAMLRRLKRAGFSDWQLADLKQLTESAMMATRHRLGLRPVYKTVDTCAGEFPSSTPYLYSCWDEENEATHDGRPTVIAKLRPEPH